MEFVCGARPRRGCVYHVGLSGRCFMSGHVPVIYRSILPDLLHCLGPAAGHMCDPELSCLCPYRVVVRVGVQLELLFCPGHMVVGQPHYALVGRASAPRHRIGVTICASGNFWLGARGRILRLLGH